MMQNPWTFACGRSRLTLAGVFGLWVWLFAAFSPGVAEICWDYTDLQNAKVPLKCVEIGDPTAPCSWNGFCNTDSDPSDCCMAVHDPMATQTIGEMHVAWHDCLGSVGTPASPPPPNRGLRWFGFHRQLEWDFNEYRETMGLGKIDSLEWCPDMNMPYGHFGAGLGSHPLGCGSGMNRPNDVDCDGCIAFDACLYLPGGGPAGCTASTGCSAGGVTFPYATLNEFENSDEVATLLDNLFHGQMHGAVANADGGGYNTDCINPNCSTRDGMFWRLHKALDDVVRAWQDVNAVDVTLVVDRSGSMSGSSGTGVGSRLDNALEAADMFADLMEEGRSDGAVNRLGIVSYSNDASNAALNMPLQDVDATLRDAGGPFATTLGAISAGGMTSIGSGIEAAVLQLCPGGSCATHIPGAGENERKAILLLTDGKENTAPCLEAGCQSGGGAEIDYTTLDVTQLCAVGLGNAASINGELLTILAERQGGIYMNNTDATGDDLKDFFTKCFAQLTDEFLGLDPAGVLAANDLAGPIVPYESCDDSRITFQSGWTDSTLPGDRLNLLVTTPNGDVWFPSPGYGEASSEQSWAFKRAPLPYLGQAQGVWNMQLLRPQEAFVNGFTSDSFVDLSQGTRIVRREIQRLCPLGKKGERSCERVLHYEDGAKGRSAYATALDAEVGKILGRVEVAKDAKAFEAQLKADSWDLIVYARQAGKDVDESYDRRFADSICDGTRAIITDTRTTPGADEILRCAGVRREKKSVNVSSIVASEGFLGEEAKLKNPGYPIFSYGVVPVIGATSASDVAGTFDSGLMRDDGMAIIGKSLAGSELNWHKNVLVTGLSKLTAFNPISVPKTGDSLTAAVRVLTPFQRKGGYPNAKMTVEVERPLAGLGGLVKERGKPEDVKGDALDSLELQLDRIKIPTKKEIYALNDLGREGDLHAGNGTFSAALPIQAAVDGMYTLHYRLENPQGPCTTKRELKHTLFVAVRVSPEHSKVSVGEPVRGQTGSVYPVRMTPQDALGNIVGPGRAAKPVCEKPCACSSEGVTDENGGTYTINVEVPESLGIESCTLEAFDARFTFKSEK